MDACATFVFSCGSFAAGFVVLALVLRTPCLLRDNVFLARAIGSLVYNVWAVVLSGWLLVSLAKREAFPWVSYSLDVQADREMMGQAEYLIFLSVGYFTSDLVLDPDPTFVVHHLVCVVACVSAYVEPTVLAILATEVLLAEIGGILYNGAKLFRGTRLQEAMREVQFVGYAFSRLCLMLPWTVYLVSLSTGLPGQLPDSQASMQLFSVFGSVLILVINIRFLLAQRARRNLGRTKKRP